MKVLKISVLCFLMLLVVPIYSKGDLAKKDSEASYESQITLYCSQIIKKGYTGNLSEGAYTAFFETFDGSRFHKVFTAPQPMQQASTFVDDLGKCKQMTLHFIQNAYRNYFFAAYSIEF